MSWMLVSAYRKRNYFAVRIFNSAQTILNVWLPANYITISAFVQDGCPDVIRSVPLTYGMSFNRGEKRRRKKRGYVSPNMRCLHLSTRGQCGPNSPNCCPHGSSLHSSRILLDCLSCLPGILAKDKAETEIGFSKRLQTICLLGLQLTAWRCGLSPCVNTPASETSEVFVRRNIISTTAAWREQSETKAKHVCGEVGWIVACCEFRRQFWFQSLT